MQPATSLWQQHVSVAAAETRLVLLFAAVCEVEWDSRIPEGHSAVLMLGSPFENAEQPGDLFAGVSKTYFLFQWSALPCSQALKEAQKHLSKSRSPAAAAQMEDLSRRISQLDRFVSAREHMLSDAATSVKICNALVGEVCTSIQTYTVEVHGWQGSGPKMFSL